MALLPISSHVRHIGTFEVVNLMYCMLATSTVLQPHCIQK